MEAAEAEVDAAVDRGHEVHRSLLRQKDVEVTAERDRGRRWLYVLLCVLVGCRCGFRRRATSCPATTPAVSPPTPPPQLHHNPQLAELQRLLAARERAADALQEQLLAQRQSFDQRLAAAEAASAEREAEVRARAKRITFTAGSVHTQLPPHGVGSCNARAATRLRLGRPCAPGLFVRAWCGPPSVLTPASKHRLARCVQSCWRCARNATPSSSGCATQTPRGARSRPTPRRPKRPPTRSCGPRGRSWPLQWPSASGSDAAE